jgi:hypothetical protein
MPSTEAGSGGGSQPTATATSARCTVGQDTPVLAGDLVDGTVGSGHGTGEVLPPPCGQPRPRRDRGGGPGERPSPARALQAAQAAHAPPQLHPPPRGGQIPGSLPAAGASPAPATRAPARRPARLNHDPEPSTSTRSISATREGVQAEQQPRRVVHAARGLACRSASEQPACAGPRAWLRLDTAQSRRAGLPGSSDLCMGVGSSVGAGAVGGEQDA